MNNRSSLLLNCLIACTCYKSQISDINRLIECFIEAIHSSNSSIIVTGFQALIVCLSNLHDEIQSYIPRIILHLNKNWNYDSYTSQIILEFLMRMFIGFSF